MTLWIVDNTVPFNRINSEWQIIYPPLRKTLSSVVKVRMIVSDYNVSGIDYTNSIGFTGSILNAFIKAAPNINNRDIVLFTDARNEMISVVFEYFTFRKIRPYFMGIWHDGIFNTNGGINKGYETKRVKKLPKSYELHLANLYDLNLFPSIPLLNLFRQNQLSSFNSKFIKLPFDLLKKSYASLGIDTENKSNSILYNTRENIENVGDLNLHYTILKRESIDKDFFNLADIKMHDWRKSLNMVIHAKIMVTLRTANVNPYDIYHAAILGVLPIMPESHLLKTYNVPDIYLLKVNKLDGKLYRFIRYVPLINEKIEYLLEHYETLKGSLVNILDDHYDSSDFINLINHVRHRNRKQLVGGKVQTQND